MAPEVVLQLRPRAQRPLCVDVVHAGDRVLPVHRPLPRRASRLPAATGPGRRCRRHPGGRLPVRLH